MDPYARGHDTMTGTRPGTYPNRYPQTMSDPYANPYAQTATLPPMPERYSPAPSWSPPVRNSWNPVWVWVLVVLVIPAFLGLLLGLFPMQWTHVVPVLPFVVAGLAYFLRSRLGGAARYANMRGLIFVMFWVMQGVAMLVMTHR